METESIPDIAREAGQDAEHQTPSQGAGQQAPEHGGHHAPGHGAGEQAPGHEGAGSLAPQETKRLVEAIEAGIRDGRTLESLKKAMEDVGYKEAEIRGIVSKVDRAKTIRRASRKKKPRHNTGWIAAGVATLAVVILVSYIAVIEPSQRPQGIEGGIFEEAGLTKNTTAGRICYVINESIKQKMIDSGAECDKWFLIKEI